MRITQNEYVTQDVEALESYVDEIRDVINQDYDEIDSDEGNGWFEEYSDSDSEEDQEKPSSDVGVAK